MCCLGVSLICREHLRLRKIPSCRRVVGFFHLQEVQASNLVLMLLTFRRGIHERSHPVLTLTMLLHLYSYSNDHWDNPGNVQSNEK